MALSRAQIVNAAMRILRDYGLADLSMRRLAKDLDVQPGALYWHVKNKQELLVVLASQILDPAVAVAPGSAREAALALRAALLSVRDGADVVSLARALRPDSLEPIQQLAALLDDGHLTEQQLGWGARTLTHFILGAVAEEQTQEDLGRAGLLPEGVNAESAEPAFTFGIDVILAGLKHPGR